MYNFICLNCGRLMFGLRVDDNCWGCFDGQIVSLTNNERRLVIDIVNKEYKVTLDMLKDLEICISKSSFIFACSLKRILYKILRKYKKSILKRYRFLDNCNETKVRLITDSNFFDLSERECNIVNVLLNKYSTERLDILNNLYFLIKTNKSLFAFSLKRKLLDELLNVIYQVKNIKFRDTVI